MVWCLIKQEIHVEWYLVKHMDDFTFTFTYIIRVASLVNTRREEIYSAVRYPYITHENTDEWIQIIMAERLNELIDKQTGKFTKRNFLICVALAHVSELIRFENSWQKRKSLSFFI
jgi:hypothetical protein